jgi:molybdate transport system permease protein
VAQFALAQPRRPASAETTRRAFDAWKLLSLPLFAFIALPLLALFLRASPPRLAANLADPQVQQAVALSLQTGLITTAITVLLGTPVAYILARRRFALKRAVDALVDLPTVLPPAVAGVALLMAFGRRGLLGGPLTGLGLHLAFTTAAVVMAQTFVAAPFYVRAALIGFGSIEDELEQAAALDGANGWQVFCRVTVPLAWPALLSGAVMTWARALGEFGATIIFAGNFPGRTQTMPLAIYMGFELELDVALTLSVILVACSFLVLILVKSLLGREPEAERDW